MAEVKEFKEVYTVEEIADLLKITKVSVYSYIKSGELKAKKIGKYWRITGENLKAFLDA